MSTTYECRLGKLSETIVVEGSTVVSPKHLKHHPWESVRANLESLHATIIPIPDHPYEISSRGETYRFRWVGNKLMSVYEIEPGGKWREMEYEEIPEHIKELL